MRVLIADPQPTVRHALSVWINGQPGWNVIGESSDSFDLLDKLNRLLPEVIIMDRDLAGLSLKELVARIRQNSGDVVIILLFNGPLEQSHTDTLDVDFRASKNDPPSRILDTFMKAKSWHESRSSTRSGSGSSPVNEKARSG